MKNCRAKVGREGDTVYLLIICGQRKEKVVKCVDVKVNGNIIEVMGGRARAVLPVEVDVDLVEKAAQTIGNWFAARLNQDRGRIGYLGEMLAKYIVYFACKKAKEKGMKLTKCLKSTELITSRGKVSWKAVYQLFSNTRDLPRELVEPERWESELPILCTLRDLGSSTSAKS
ncbi:hypothetical protein IPA_08525 [Ignicoccus pacificus DSM 13166]|uniref:Uncharacterized protein n=1 Tax=Ignicoccus pacificus DSM 13166 TaxID=940294 RepID=A0A977KDC5_9CREN|nr:hypothetical protein IPA_08525 [Ignicoccus pacificus DSM 13166]